MSKSASLHSQQALDGPFFSSTLRRRPQEVKMRDELYDREYQAGRDVLHSGIDRLIEGAAKSLRVLHTIQFDAPWKRNVPAKNGRTKLV